MNGQEYLDEISKKSKPISSGGGSPLDKILHSPFFLVGAIGIGLLIVIMIIGSFLGGGDKGSEQSLATALQLHLDSTSEIIREYQPNVKSSDLRSSSASLYSVIANTSSSVSTYLTEAYGKKGNDKETSAKLTAAAEEAKTELNDELFEAKINGILDRIYAHKMAYEISLFLNEESKLIEKTKDETFATQLSESYTSLENLYEQFDNFSEGK